MTTSDFSDEPRERAPAEGLPLVGPDDAEQAAAATGEAVLPERKPRALPVVGLGGSAGGIPALRRVRAWRSWGSCTWRPTTTACCPNCCSTPRP